MLILYHANIYTQYPEKPRATAIAIEMNRIIAVGNDDELLSLANSNSIKQNMEGMTIWPGLTDSHIHLENYALGLGRVECETETHEECIKRVAEQASKTLPGAWIIGWGWNHNAWGGKYGNAEELDKAAPANPVFLTHKSGHSAWVNSSALKLANITSSTNDPEGGHILKDINDQPTGILLETASSLVERVIPESKINEIEAAILSAQDKLLRFGITCIHDFDQTNCFKALQNLNNQEKLKLRVVKSIPMDCMQSAINAGLHTGFGNNFLRIGSVKLFSDGALGPQTAAMINDYEGQPGNKGILLMDSDQVFDLGRKAIQNGLSLAIHAIGDQANRAVIDGYERLRIFEQTNHLPHLRHRIEHVQLLEPSDFGRLAKFDLIASVQPIHATSDIFIADKHWGERAAGAYAFRTLLDHKTILTFGSDAPVESPNPFLGIHACVTRKRPNGQPGINGWYPNQRLSLHEALNGYTTGSAFTAGTENRTGKIKAGYLADVILFKTDPFTLPSDELHSLLPYATMVNGQWY